MSNSRILVWLLDAECRGAVGNIQRRKIIPQKTWISSLKAVSSVLCWPTWLLYLDRYKISICLCLQLWQHQSHFMSSSPVVCIATSKLSITTAMPPPCYVMVALADGSIHCLYRDSLKQVRSKITWVTWNFISSTPLCALYGICVCILFDACFVLGVWAGIARSI